MWATCWKGTHMQPAGHASWCWQASSPDWYSCYPHWTSYPSSTTWATCWTGTVCHPRPFGAFELLKAVFSSSIVITLQRRISREQLIKIIVLCKCASKAPMQLAVHASRVSCKAVRLRVLSCDFENGVIPEDLQHFLIWHRHRCGAQVVDHLSIFKCFSIQS